MSGEATGTFGCAVDGFGLARAMFTCSLAGLGAATDGSTRRGAGAAGKREGRQLVDLRSGRSSHLRLLEAFAYRSAERNLALLR